MTGFLDLNTTLDVEYGERISVTRSDKHDTARLELYLNPDGLGYADAVMTYLSPIQCKALAALLLIQAEELERAQP